MKHHYFLRTAGKLLTLVAVLLTSIQATAGTKVNIVRNSSVKKAYLSHNYCGAMITDISQMDVPTLYLPSDYQGTPEFESFGSNTVTIDKTTGELTVGYYAQKSTGAISDITVTLPKSGSYSKQELFFTVAYYAADVNIYKQDDWEKMCSEGSGTVRRITLHTDVSVNNDYDTQMSSFNGLFEGNGHCINVDFSISDYKSATFSTGHGLIRNTEAKGTAEFQRGNSPFSQHRSAAFVYDCNRDL